MTRTWLVYIDREPIDPAHPLDRENAAATWADAVAKYPGRQVDLRECVAPIPLGTLKELCDKAKELGLAEAGLGPHPRAPQLDTPEAVAARVIRAVHARLPDRERLGLTEGRTLGTAVVQALNHNSPGEG